MGLTGHSARPPGRRPLGERCRRSSAAWPSVIAPPTLQAAFWMVLLLIPLAAFFSAVCLSLAVLARSMKEGQYYMTPLYLICLPLIFLTLMPGIELNLFYSLVPITGVALLLRALIMGNYDVALRYFLARAGADRGLRRGGAPLGGRPVSARGGLVPRGRAVQSVLPGSGTCSATASPSRPAARRSCASP